MHIRANVSTIFFLSIAAALPLAAEDVKSGIDVWATPCCSASDFLELPAGFFGSGSDLLRQSVALQGSALPSLGGPSLERIDTVVERLETAELPACGDSDWLDIEIRALRLRAPAPLIVTYNGGENPEPWDLEVCLSSHYDQPRSSMRIKQQCPEGGTFSSTLQVLPKFIFRRRSDDHEVIWDPGDKHPIVLTSEGHWVHDPDSSLNVIGLESGAVTDGDCDGRDDEPLPATSNFAPGIQVTPCSCDPAAARAQSSVQGYATVDHMAEFARHAAEIATRDQAGVSRSFPEPGPGPGTPGPHPETRRPRPDIRRQTLFTIPIAAAFAVAVWLLSRRAR